MEVVFFGRGGVRGSVAVMSCFGGAMEEIFGMGVQMGGFGGV